MRGISSLLLFLVLLLAVGLWAGLREKIGILPEAFSSESVEISNESANSVDVGQKRFEQARIVDGETEADRLRSLRRAFQKNVLEIGTVGDPGQVIELEGVRIYTSSGSGLKIKDGTDSTAYFVQFKGPIRPEWRDRVEAIGGVVHGYVPKHALSVDLTPAMAKQLFSEPFVHWIHPIEPEHKIQPFIESLTQMNKSDAPDVIPLTISTFTPDDVRDVAGELASWPVVIKAVEAGRRWGWIHADVPRSHIADIASLDRVQWIEERVQAQMFNDRAVAGLRMNVTNVWFARGLSGAGQIIGHADTGLDVGNMTNLHQDLRGRVIAAYGLGRPGLWNDTHGHGTHTAGSIFGNGIMSTGLFRGVAWEAQLVHQSLLDNFGGLGGLPPNLSTLFYQTYEHGARIHADSWGSSVFGVYSTASRQSDEFMWDHPDMLLVFAAGNDGRDANADGVVDADSMAAPATAKNVLTVGAAEGGRATGEGGFSSSTYYSKWPGDYAAQPIRSDFISQSANLTNQGMAAFSSRGPTDDGRIKPDVVAPGTDVVSTRSRTGSSVGWGVNANTNYNFNGGTSMSTPLVAGAAALVRQYFQEHRYHETPSAALLKAAMIHGARSLYPGQYGEGAHLEIPASIPNRVEGWGHVDVEGTLFPSEANWFYIDQNLGIAAPGDIVEHEFFASAGPVKITLYYTDFPAVAGVGLKLVNDLAISLHGPGDVELFSHLDSDDLNNSERILFHVETPGMHRVRVHGVVVPEGPQPYAVIVSGDVHDAPVIIHEPLMNTYITDEPYQVDAVVISSVSMAPNEVSLFWRSAGGTTDFHEVAMTHVTGDVFTAEIPAHANPSELHYYVKAVVPGFTTVHPPEAPDAFHSFRVTDPVTLTVSATPSPIFAVSPDYGVHTFASGNVVHVSAPAYTNTAPGIRVAIAGWTGTGSVPAAGDEAEVEVQLDEDSSITWEWVTQYALSQTSTVAGILNTTSWWSAWSMGSTVPAVSELTHGGTPYGFAGWLVDGLRQPNASSVAINPAAGLVMYGPRAATAIYLPASQDANANGLPDWWEQFYFGTNITYAVVDSDNDGYTNVKEYQDRTNPRDVGSTPQPPSIAHIPLGHPQTSPAPWSLSAIIVDNYAVSNALVFWRRNGGDWTSSVMTATAGTNFTGMIHAPGLNRDHFQYRIEARDYAGLVAISGPFSFEVAYPEIDATPVDFGEINLPADTTTNLLLLITNAGVATLEWNLSRALFHDHMESGTGTWSRAGMNNVWHIQTNRVFSGVYAWHFGNGPSGLYPDSADAWIDMEPVRLDAAARLLFVHWARMEYDEGQLDDHYWDGGVVELSTDDGATYAMIEPVGGYPHRITANLDSPFPPDTPCYGETDGWEPAEFDLSAYTGQTVRIRFRFGSDKYVREEGWYIDDIRIVYQDDNSWTWLQVDPSGSVGAEQADHAAILLDSAPLILAERRHATLVLAGNDPERNAPILIPVAIHNASREITVTHGLHGSVSPDGVVRVVVGEDAAFWIQPDNFYVVGEIFTNGESAFGWMGSDAVSFVWPDPQSNGTLHVTFDEKMISGLVPEWWLHAHGLTNDHPEVEAETDHDGDGMLSWQEYWASTDPLDTNSVALIIWRVTPGDTNPVIEWLSFTNTAYQYELLVTTNLAEGFVPVAHDLPATPPVNVFTNESASPAFEAYRVLAVP